MSKGKYMPTNGAKVAEAAKKRFEELEHKGWDWSSFYNGYLEGFQAFYTEFAKPGYHMKRESEIIKLLNKVEPKKQ